MALNPTRTAIALAAFAALAAPLAFAVLPAAAGAADSRDRTSYVLFAQGDHSISMSGSSEDLERARELRNGEESFLYMRRGDSVYVIRDPETLARAEAIFEPQSRLGAQQAELGSRQAALGARQAELGAEQAALAHRQHGASRDRIAELGRQQAELGRRQGELGREQGELGRQQGELGREQGRLAREAQVALAALVEEARERGVAQLVN